MDDMRSEAMKHAFDPNSGVYQNRAQSRNRGGEGTDVSKSYFDLPFQLAQYVTFSIWAKHPAFEKATEEAMKKLTVANILPIAVRGQHTKTNPWQHLDKNMTRILSTLCKLNINLYNKSLTRKH